VVCAADHATVDELATRARAARVAAGEVEAEGVVAGNHVVGVGDEIVTTRNDRRLVTSRAGWVRNGDRWQVLARQGENSLLVEDLGGRGRVVLPVDYVHDEVAPAYAVTIHKAQGLTVDRSILLVDNRTTAEGLYVGMTRGRSSNLALAVCDHAAAEHAPAGAARSKAEVVLGAMGRSAAFRPWKLCATPSSARSPSSPWPPVWPTSMPGSPERRRPIDPRRCGGRPRALTMLVDIVAPAASLGRDARIAAGLRRPRPATPPYPHNGDVERNGLPSTPRLWRTGISSLKRWPSAAMNLASERPSPSPPIWSTSSALSPP
jgi:hypothetical protein